MSTDGNIFADIIVFLRDTLQTEELSSNANQRRLTLLQKILSRESTILFPYVDMNGCHKSMGDVESATECYEELESTWSDSAASSNLSRTYSNTLPSTNKHQRFNFFFGNVLGDSKNKGLSKVGIDTTDIANISKRNSVLSDSDNSLSPSSIKSEDSLEIMSISASAVKYSAVKCGLLFRKEKTLFFEYSKRLWIALLGISLFIYNSEKDTKPAYTVNIDDYNARPIASTQTNKKEFGFEIICPGKKTYQFYSTSKCEMDTWILSINHSVPLPQTSSAMSTERQTTQVTQVSVDHLDSKLAEYSQKRNRDLCRYDNDTRVERELPSPPCFLHYDTPNPACQAVLPGRIMDRCSTYSSNGFQETFYYSIDDELIAEKLARYDYPIRNDPVFVNKKNIDEQNHNPDDTLYYNLLDNIRVIKISEKNSSPSDHTNNISVSNGEDNENNVCHKKGFSRIRQLIQKMEEINNQNNSFTKKVNSLANESKLLNSQTSSMNEQIYELVNSPTYVNINA